MSNAADIHSGERAKSPSTTSSQDSKVSAISLGVGYGAGASAGFLAVAVRVEANVKLDPAALLDSLLSLGLKFNYSQSLSTSPGVEFTPYTVPTPVICGHMPRMDSAVHERITIKAPILKVSREVKQDEIIECFSPGSISISAPLTIEHRIDQLNLQVTLGDILTGIDAYVSDTQRAIWSDPVGRMMLGYPDIPR